jgi:hypothetical protein
MSGFQISHCNPICKVDQEEVQVTTDCLEGFLDNYSQSRVVSLGGVSCSTGLCTYFWEVDCWITLGTSSKVSSLTSVSLECYLNALGSERECQLV